MTGQPEKKKPEVKSGLVEGMRRIFVIISVIAGYAGFICLILLLKPGSFAPPPTNSEKVLAIVIWLAGGVIIGGVVYLILKEFFEEAIKLVTWIKEGFVEKRKD